jgi:hypothetical protein
MKKDLLLTIGKERLGVIYKAMHALNKRSMGILFGESIHIYIGKHIMGEHIPEDTQFKVVI